MQKQYKSKDFYSSAYLLANGIDLLEIQKEGFQTVFVFEDDNRTQELLNQYFSMRAQVNAAQYASAIKNLKSVIHNSNSNQQMHNEKQSQCY